MPTIHSRAWVAAPIDEVFAFFDDPANLARLMPPPAAIRVVRMEPLPPQAGTEIEFRYGIGPIRRTWLIRYVAYEPNMRIVDETLSGPMRHFLHSHTFTPARRGIWIDDRVDYHVGPDGVIGSVADWVAGWAMRAVFIWRALRQRQLLR